MSDTLDKNLDKIMQTWANTDYNTGYKADRKFDNAIKQIKQAFTDAGYKQYQETPKSYQDRQQKNMMTGSEWYERFREEMHGRFIPFARSEDGEVILLIEEIDEAAKRAANIQENQ